MKKLIHRILATTLIVAAILGILFNASAVFLTWKYKNPVTSAAKTTVGLLTTILDESVQGLEVAINALDTSIRSINALQNAMNATADTIQSTKPILEALGGLMDGILPMTVVSAQAALNSAQEGARVIDTVLRVFSSLPFVSPDLYNPQTPLHQGLADLSQSLDSLPQTFEQMSGGINSSASNVETIQREVAAITSDIGAIATSLKNSRAVLQQYQSAAADLSARLKALDRNLPTIMNVLAALITFVFVWLTLAMVGLLLQGTEALGYRLQAEGAA